MPSSARIKDIRPGEGASRPVYLQSFRGALFFAADDGMHGVELWKSDGSAAGTTLVKDLRPGASHALPSYLTEFQGSVWFAATDGAQGMELWRFFWTAAATALMNTLSLHDALPI